jgi:hypothetical protein
MTVLVLTIRAELGVSNNQRLKAFFSQASEHSNELPGG